MDADAVRTAASRLDTEAGQLAGIVSAIENLVAGLAHVWSGHDVHEFSSWWHTQHKPKLTTAHDAIAGLAQSARNNAAAQDQTSGVSGSPSPNPNGPALPPRDTPTAPQDASLPGSTRTWEEVQRDYEARGAAMGLGGYAAGQAYGYQCTAWANYRWRELGYDGKLIPGDGGDMAANAGGSVGAAPSLGAMASYSGHVMIVEQVLAGGNQIRVSEMNTGSDHSSIYDANPQEYSDTSVFTRQPDGSWLRQGAKVARQITFATLPN
jgi:surface antigen